MNKKELEAEIRMVSAVSRALELRRIENDNEKIFKNISELVSKEKSETIKLGMIAAAAKALEIAEKNPKLKEKEIIKRTIKELSYINKIISEHSIKKSK